jgi:hypothetical protein
MGDRDERIKTLHDRQSEIGVGASPAPGGGAIGEADRRYREARDTMDRGDARDAQAGAAETERNALLEELARVEGELKELQSGETDARKATPAVGEQELPDTAPVEGTVAAEPASPTAPPDPPPVAPEDVAREAPAPQSAEPERDERRQDWEKLDVERALHGQHLNEIKGAEADWRTQIAAATAEMEKLGLDRHGQRAFEHNEFSFAADTMNRLFAGQDQQRESLYAVNVAEDATVRGAQMAERGAMQAEMTALRAGLVSEVCALEARQEVQDKDVGRQEQYRDKMTRDGVDASVIDGNVEVYGQRLAMDSMDRESGRSQELQQENFPQVVEAAQSLGVQPQQEQAGPTL